MQPFLIPLELPHVHLYLSSIQDETIFLLAGQRTNANGERPPPRFLSSPPTSNPNLTIITSNCCNLNRASSPGSASSPWTNSFWRDRKRQPRRTRDSRLSRRTSSTTSPCLRRGTLSWRSWTLSWRRRARRRRSERRSLPSARPPLRRLSSRCRLARPSSPTAGPAPDAQGGRRAQLLGSYPSYQAPRRDALHRRSPPPLSWSVSPALRAPVQKLSNCRRAYLALRGAGVLCMLDAARVMCDPRGQPLRPEMAGAVDCRVGGPSGTYMLLAKKEWAVRPRLGAILHTSGRLQRTSLW